MPNYIVYPSMVVDRPWRARETAAGHPRKLVATTATVFVNKKDWVDSMILLV